MLQDRFKDVDFFENDKYAGMLTDSSKFLSEARNTGNRDENIFLDF